MKIEKDRFQDAALESLENTATKALACPCLANLRYGPCGEEFSTAFVCFIKSQEPEKGSDCVLPFQKMQNCMTSSSKDFLKDEENDTHISLDMQNQNVEAESFAGSKNKVAPQLKIEEQPPSVPAGVIKLPRWYSKGVNRQTKKSE